MVPYISLLVISLSLIQCNAGVSYNALWNDLSQLYQLQQLGNGDDGYYDEGLSSRSSPDEDWSFNYRDQTLNDPDIFSEASIRDQEYPEQSPLWGYQSVSGGTGDGKENPKQVKTDKVLPAYCNPPNPCPIGYTEDDNCLVNFENTPDNNRNLMKQQECPCDAEHMMSCPSDGKSTKSLDSADMNSIRDELQGSLENNPFISTSEKRINLVAKKTPSHKLHKRDTERVKSVPYNGGKPLLVAKKGQHIYH